MMILYGADISPFAQRVALQLEYKELEFRVESPPGGLRSDAYRAINPIGKIPFLEADELTLPESEIICEYIEEVYPEPQLLPTDPADRAKARLISRISDLYLMNPMAPLFANLSRKTRNQEVVDNALQSIKKGLQALDHWIAPEPFATAGTLTLADFAAAPILRYVAEYPPIFGMKEPFADFGNIAAYYSACREDPHVDRGLTRIEAGWAALRAG